MPTLADALEFLRSEVAPRAKDLDESGDAMASVLREMGKRKLLGLRCPPEFGGEPLTEAEFRIFQQECARASGAFAFLQTQHQSAVALLSKADNLDLAKEVLAEVADGTRKVGIGFSQLRRPGEPLLRAERVDEGVILDGHVPWVTGHGHFPEFLVAGQFPNGEAVFAVVPLRTQSEVTVSNPMKLAAMETARTVTVDFRRFFVAWDRVAFCKPAGWIARNDMINVALQGHFAVGNARGSLDVLAAISGARRTTNLSDSADQLESEWLECKTNLERLSETAAEETTEERLLARAWAIDIMQRCAWAAVTSSAGAANATTHPAQRLLREALVFTVSAQTSAIRDATLARLVRNRDT